MKSIKITETKRIYLDNLNLNDVNDLCEILSDSETMQYYPAPYNHEQTIGWIEGAIESYKKNGFELWAVRLRNGNKFIGQCGITLQKINNKTVPEIGYHINKKYWRNGFATEAAGACL